jgi:hypothetical protein
LRSERRQPRLDRLLAPGDRIGDIELEGPELAAGVAIDVPDLLHLIEVEHRLAHFESQRRVHLVDAEQVRLRTDERYERSNELFADRVDRGVGHLRKQLLEIMRQRLVLARQHCERRVVAHRADRLLAIGGNRLHDDLDIFLRVRERLLPIEQRHRGAQRRRLLGIDVVELDPDALDPFRVGPRRSERILQLLVVNDAALSRGRLGTSFPAAGATS